MKSEKVEAAAGVSKMKCLTRGIFKKHDQMYDGPSVKEKMNQNLFSLPFIGERK